MTPPRFTLNLGEGSVTFAFPASAAQQLQGAIAQLLETFKASAAPATTVQSTVTQITMGETPPAERPPVARPPVAIAPKPVMEYTHTGEVFLEIFCNPNIWPTPFAAKVLITLRDERIRLTTEAELSRLIEDVNQFIEQAS